MKLLISAFLLIKVFFINGQINPYPCKSFDDKEDFIFTSTISSIKSLDNPDFRSQLRGGLINKISSYVESTTTVTFSNSLKNKKGKKNTDSEARVISNSVLNNPIISVCNFPGSDEMFVTMSINKHEYAKSIYTYFIRKLKSESAGISSLLDIGNINNRKIYKEQLQNYKQAQYDLNSLIPQVNLNKEDQDLFDNFSKDVYLLENQYVSWKKNKTQKLKDRGQSIIDGIFKKK